MTSFSTADEAYEAVKRAALEFPGCREWEQIVAIYEIWPEMISARWRIRNGGNEDKKGKAPPGALKDASIDAAAYLRDNVLKATGARIWGLTFTLFRDGKFDIAYDYTKPASYTEQDDALDLEGQNLAAANVLDGLVKRGAKAQINEAMEHFPASREIQKLRASLLWLQARTAAETSNWALGSEQNWNADLNEGWLRWTFGDGRIVQADVQVVGTYNTADGTFLWGWDHPSVPKPLQRAASCVRAVGAREGFDRLTTRSVVCTEDEAWQFAALASQLDGASGAYRGNSNGTWVYFTYGPPVRI